MFVDERFINKAQFDTGFAHPLILKDGAVPAIKDPGHDSELQMCFVGDRRLSARHSLALPTAPPGARLFSERIIKLHFSFINMIKLKTFWR